MSVSRKHELLRANQSYSTKCFFISCPSPGVHSSDEDVTNFLISLIPQLTINHPESNEEISAEDSIPTEALFLPRVYELLKDNNIVSCGMLQRELGLGYGLAARIVDALVSIGIAVFNSENKTYEIRKDKIHLIEPYIK
jgi:hypothetical protein